MTAEAKTKNRRMKKGKRYTITDETVLRKKPMKIVHQTVTLRMILCKTDKLAKITQLIAIESLILPGKVSFTSPEYQMQKL